MNSHNSIDVPGQILFSDSSGKIKSKPIISTQHTFFLDEAISEPANYRDEIHTLVHANDGDAIDIVINSPGGMMHTALAYCEAIKFSRASVTAVILGECASAATIIALNCPQVLVTDSAEFMIHTASFGSWGKSNNVKDHVDFTNSQVNTLIESTYAGFLTAKEIEKVKAGVEFWFNADETRERFQKRMTYIQNQARRAEREAKKIILGDGGNIDA